MDNVTVLNFDHTYYAQNFLQNYKVNALDFEQIPNKSLYCEKDSLRQMGQLLERENSKITFLGSGNYHYISYILLSRIEVPFTLLLFDHHTDSLPSPGESVISCGSWVYEALEHLPNLEQVIMIGVKQDWQQMVPAEYRHKIVAYPESTLPDNYSTMTQEIKKNIPTNHIYISVDKDVLDKSQADTIWDQGSMQLTQLTGIIKAIMADKHIIGMDICGEYPVTPTNEFANETRIALEKNTMANRYILEQLFKNARPLH